MSYNVEHFRELLPTLVERSAKRIHAELEGYRDIELSQVQTLANNSLTQFIEDLIADTPHRFAEFWRKITEQRLQAGIPLDSVLQAIEIAEEEVQKLVQEHVDDNDDQIKLIIRTHHVVRSAVVSMYRVYEALYNNLLEAQQSAIRELSTPIVPIHEGILVLPLVGSIDSSRAATIIEQLLEAITLNQADVVIMDITGVPVIDTGVANYLLQAARAVRLLGSQVVLVGISAEIAQTIVQLGIELTGLTTRSNLQAGIEYALSLLNLAICEQAPEAE